MFLYTASQVMVLPGVRAVISTVILARTGTSPVTLSEFASKATLLFKLTDMKAVEHAVLPELAPLASAVRVKVTCPEGGMTVVTLGPVGTGV
jgi:hypothetical protein